MTGTSAGPMTARGHRLEGQKMRKVLGGVYRAETHVAGEGGEEERAVHDGRMPVEIGGVAYYKILLSNPILR